MFLNTVGLHTDKAVETALKNAVSDTVVPNKKGKNKTTYTIPAEDDTFLTHHIMSFNLSLSHYRREHAPNRLYFSNEISIAEMYNNYAKECEDNNRKKYSYPKYYSKVKDLHISFVKLWIEEYETCEEHKVHACSRRHGQLGFRS